jgi:hypothetical protein
MILIALGVTVVVAVWAYHAARIFRASKADEPNKPFPRRPHYGPALRKMKKRKENQR